jgi:tetratricopeptide (TPR) repeat protein
MKLAVTLVLLSLNGVNEAHQRGVALYKHQKYVEAVAALQEAIKTEPPATVEYAESALLIGQSYFMLQQAPQAIPWLERVTSVREANYVLGCLLANRTARPIRGCFRPAVRLEAGFGGRPFARRPNDA